MNSVEFHIILTRLHTSNERIQIQHKEGIEGMMVEGQRAPPRIKIKKQSSSAKPQNRLFHRSPAIEMKIGYKELVERWITYWQPERTTYQRRLMTLVLLGPTHLECSLSRGGIRSQESATIRVVNAFNAIPQSRSVWGKARGREPR
jgi:hypothetical protein